MNILTATISQMVTDKANIAIVNEYNVAYGISVVMFTFDLGPF